MNKRRAANAPPPAATASERERCRPQVLSLLVLTAAWSSTSMGCAPTLVGEWSESSAESEGATDVEEDLGRRASAEDPVPPADPDLEGIVEVIEATSELGEQEVPEIVPLTAADLRLGPGWELAPHPITLSNAAKADPEQTLSDEELRQQAEEDPAWRAADGERYEALIVLEDGTSFGRRGPAPTAPTPDPSNDFGSPYPPEPDGEVPDVDPEAAILPCNDLICDRRTRVSNTSTLQQFPERAIGALNLTFSPGVSLCTATKVGPRAVITASHCVLEEYANGGQIFNTPGMFHPGQTNSSHPNGLPIYHSGLFLRDHRIDHKFDYAVLYLTDTLASAGLGFLGAEFYPSAPYYEGKLARLLGYPIETSECLASPLSNNHCDGWMYRHSNPLSAALYSNGQIGYDIDATGGQSGSSLITYTNGLWTVLGVHWGRYGGTNYNSAARYRTQMWDDVCSAIAAVPSIYGSHALCY